MAYVPFRFNDRLGESHGQRGWCLGRTREVAREAEVLRQDDLAKKFDSAVHAWACYALGKLMEHLGHESWVIRFHPLSPCSLTICTFTVMGESEEKSGSCDPYI